MFSCSRNAQVPFEESPVNLIKTWAVNRALSFLHGGSLEITITVPLGFFKLNLTCGRLMALNMPVN